jgi:hypothetical protein
MDCTTGFPVFIPQSAENCGTTFNAIGRLLHLCAPVRKSLCDDLEELSRWAAGTGLASAGSASGKMLGRVAGSTGAAVVEGEEADEPALRASLNDLDDGVFFGLAGFLDTASLGALDVACRQTRELNRSHGGPWYAHGLRDYRGLELDADGVFELDGIGGVGRAVVGRKLPRVDWKSRYGRFSAEVPMFRAPFAGREISVVQQPDEIAYCRCRFRTDLLGPGEPQGLVADSSAASSAAGFVYMEVEVTANPDNVSLAVVDFEAGGCSSVTFSPDTGAVIRERKVCESPRKVEGAYIQPLTTTTPGRGFEGSMGLFLHNGHLAFFRRHASRTEEGGDATLGPWECTGYVTDLSWAEGRRLTPCLAFRNEGTYEVRMVCVNSSPPLIPQKNAMAYDDTNWSSLDWDAGQEEEEGQEQEM